MSEEFTKCNACGMILSSATEYHPFLACRAFETIRNGNTVQGNLKKVVEYGMKAQKQGLTITEAMNELDKVHK